MKHLYHFILITIFTTALNAAFGQDVNWKALQPSQKHVVNVYAGFDHGSVLGISYGYQLNTKKPIILNLEYSAPFGEKYFDDFKTKIGAQYNFFRTDNLFATVKAYSVFRRFENDFARILNFGSEFSGTFGYYQPKWFAAADFGFDKAIVTHFKHSDLMKQYNPQLISGWYVPTGGNYFFGVQGGYSFPRNDVYVKAGKTLSQEFKTVSLVPYYFQLGLNMKW